MQTVYGNALPPTMEGSTQGELRVRVEKLILDDETINHNPLVRLFDSNSDGNSAANSGAGKKSSPNRFVVPVDFCTVSPLFFGEAQPSATCQPATPQQSARGSVTLVYPVKTTQEAFLQYLQSLQQQTPQGLTLQVSVPSSYSGRPTLVVGRSVVNLDPLQDGKAVSGWFTVGHMQKQSPDTEEKSTAEGDGFLLPIGKVKVHISIQYFSPSAKSRRTSSAVSSPKKSISQPSHSPKKETDAVKGKGTPSPKKETNHSLDTNSSEGVAAPSMSTIPPTSLETNSQGSYNPVPGLSTTGLPDTNGNNVRVDEIIKKGLDLRDRMTAASSKGYNSVDAPPRASTPSDGPDAYQDPPPHPNLPSSGLVKTPVPAHVVSSRAKNADLAGDAVDDDDESQYTSECSDNEQFALQLQQETEVREAAEELKQKSDTEENSTPHSAGPKRPTTLMKSPFSLHSSPGAHHRRSGENVLVDLLFQDIAFAATDFTNDLKEIRLSVRLSKDVTTEEPAAAPFSSFVHQIPLVQNNICLSFLVRSFSEEHSRIVVECFKVNSRPATVQGTKLLHHSEPNAPRVIVSEELLGIAVIGFYAQSRDLVLREPVSNENHVRTRLTVRIDGSDAPKVDLGNTQPSDTGSEKEEGEEEDGTEAVTSTSSKKKSRVSFGGNLGWEHENNDEAFQDEDEANAESTAQLYGKRFSSAAVEEKRKSVASKRNSTIPLSREEIVNPYHATQFPSRHASLTRGALTTADAGVGAYLPVTDTASSPLKSSLSVGSPFVYEATAPKGNNPFRLHIAINGARQLPLVAVGKGDAQDYLSLVHSGDSFVEPSTFFVVEEVFSGTEKFNSAAVSEWTVEEATGGFFDRTRIVPQSQKPQYNYECIVNLPHESVFLQQQVPTAEREELKSMQRRGVTLRKETLLDNTPAEIGNTKPCLQQVLLTLWHMQGPLDPVRNAEEEMQFWAKAAYIGECRVDLRPLRYIRRIEGYYRISRGDCRLPEVEGGAPLVLPPSSRNSGNTVGYVHLGISLV